MKLLLTDKPVTPLNKPQRDALNAFLTVHRRYMDRETKTLQHENELLRTRLQAVRERETLKFR